MGMSIGTFIIRNNGTCIYALGDKNFVPGGKQVEVSKEEAEHPHIKQLVADGKLQLIQGGLQQTSGTEASELDKMTVAQLKAYAVEQGISLGDATKREDILAILKQGE